MGGNPAYTLAPSLSVNWQVELSSNQTPYNIPASQKGPLLVLLLTDLPKLLGTHFCFLFISPSGIKISIVYYPLMMDSFHLLSVHVCLSHPQLLTGLLRNAQPASELGECRVGVTHSLLSHQLYKVTRGPERGGVGLSARRASREGHQPQPIPWTPLAGIRLMELACKPNLLREDRGGMGSGIFLPLSYGWDRAGQG